MGERNYGPAVDMWGAGCIMAEVGLNSVFNSLVALALFYYSVRTCLYSFLLSLYHVGIVNVFFEFAKNYKYELLTSRIRALQTMLTE